MISPLRIIVTAAILSCRAMPLKLIRAGVSTVFAANASAVCGVRGAV